MVELSAAILHGLLTVGNPAEIALPEELLARLCVGKAAELRPRCIGLAEGTLNARDFAAWRRSRAPTDAP